jgi:hypothetical protein
MDKSEFPGADEWRQTIDGQPTCSYRCGLPSGTENYSRFLLHPEAVISLASEVESFDGALLHQGEAAKNVDVWGDRDLRARRVAPAGAARVRS